MYWIYTLFPVVKLSYFPRGLNYVLICDSGKLLPVSVFFFFFFFFKPRNCRPCRTRTRAATDVDSCADLWKKDGNKCSLLSLHSLHLINSKHWVCSRVIWWCARVFLPQWPRCDPDTCKFISQRARELYLVKSASASALFFRRGGRTLRLKRSWWVRVQYQGFCQPTALWNESEHSWSDSLLEPRPPWATMRRLLQERTWCGNYVTKRSARDSNGSSNCCLFCVWLAWCSGTQQRILHG